MVEAATDKHKLSICIVAASNNVVITRGITKSDEIRAKYIVHAVLQLEVKKITIKTTNIMDRNMPNDPSSVRDDPPGQ